MVCNASSESVYPIHPRNNRLYKSKKEGKREEFTHETAIDLRRASSASTASPTHRNHDASFGRTVFRNRRLWRGLWNRFSGIGCASTQPGWSHIGARPRSLAQIAAFLRRDYRKCSCVRDNPNPSMTDRARIHWTNSIRILWTVIASPSRDNGTGTGLFAAVTPDTWHRVHRDNRS